MSCCQNKSRIIIDNKDIADLESIVTTIENKASVVIQVIKEDADANPKVTVKCSIDDREEKEDSTREWTNYSTATTDVEVDEDSIIILIDNFQPKYIKVVVDENGATTGTITALLLRKE